MTNTHNISHRRELAIALDIEKIYNTVYALSAWHSATNGEGTIIPLSSDNKLLLEQALAEAHGTLCARMGGYLSHAEMSGGTLHYTMLLGAAFGASPLVAIVPLMSDYLAYSVLARYYPMKDYAEKSERALSRLLQACAL